MLLLQRGALLKRRGRRIRCRCHCGRIPSRRGDAKRAMRGREGGQSGGSGGVKGFLAGERMVALVPEAAVVEGVRRVGAGAVGGRRVMMGKIVVDVGAVKGALETIAVTAESGSAGRCEGFEAFFHALSRKISFLIRNFWMMVELNTFASTVCHFSPTRSPRIFHICSRRSL